MPRKTAVEKEEAKLLRLQKKEEREKRKESKKEKLGKSGPKSSKATKSNTSLQTVQSEEDRGRSELVELPEDALSLVFCFLPAKALAALCSTCQSINYHLKEGRIQHLLSRLDQTTPQNPSAIYMCEGEMEVRTILENSLLGGNTNRSITKKGKKGIGADEYPCYARFIEEALCGYAVQNYGKESFLPEFVNGRFISTSPEHTVCRIGGNDDKGGGSGVTCWGVGKRGQLGQGKRADEALPTPLLGGIGYKVRIVQVSAGGGLVRVAHSLLLTSTGRLLSFGTAQYGQLGHGYSAGKQLPDELRPRYVEALSRFRVTCISAGELHSAAVTDDGDLYTWGDGFCGQLGLGGKRPQLLPQQVTKSGLEDECVSVVSCGARHTLCVTEDGEAFSFGLGQYGALGRSFTPFEYDTDDPMMPNVDGEADNPPAVAAAAPPVAVAEAAPATNGLDVNIFTQLDLLANVTLNDSSDQCIPMSIDSLSGTHIVGASAGHRHSMLLDKYGNLYSFGNGAAGELGHGTREKQSYPMRIMEFVEIGTKIIQMSAGVDFSMAVCAKGNVYSWGRARGGRLGLTMMNEGEYINIPRKVQLLTKAVDVECGYVHAMIVGADGTLFQCGKVGVHGNSDGQDENLDSTGAPVQVPDLNIWHRTPEPKQRSAQTERWKKYGKYELKGRSKMLSEAEKWS